MRKHALKLVTLLSILTAVAFLPQRAAADEDDPPARVARLSHTDGSVSFDPAGTDDWVAAIINRPITTGDKLWVDKNSRAELQLGSASIRVGSNTGFSFLDLGDNVAQLQLTAGTLRIRVRRLQREETFEIDTPNLAFSIYRPGIYRINVNEAGDATFVEVRDGEGSVTGGGQSFDLRDGESGDFTGTEQLNADIQGLPGDDDFDAWCDERDRHEDHSISARYVSEDAVGYTDLDDYGGWRQVPEYGEVWFPHTVVVGWAPYRFGHWVYIFPWGYTWVEDEPWGFAPFHYGRWVVVGGVWGWVPCAPAAVGVAYVRPVYAPALVAWVGGPHFAVGVSVGGPATVGWFPLGPREVYVPSYHVSRNYVTNVNVTNTTVNTTVINNYYNTTVVNKTTITNVTYVNQRVPGAVTAVSARSVATAQPISKNIVHVDERQMASAPVAVRAPGVTPERQAVIGEGRATSVRPPAQVVSRTVVAKTTPPPPPPRFETQQTLIKQNGGQPPALSQVREKYTNDARQSAVKIAPPVQPGTPQNAERNNGRSRMERPNNQPNNPAQNEQVNRQQNNDRPANERPANPAQNERPANPAQNEQANRPQNNDRPANERRGNPAQNERPANPAQNEQANRPQNNDRPANERPANPAQNEQANRPQDNERPANNPPANNQHSDRPPSARPSNTSPNQHSNEQQLEQKHQQELENLHNQQDQQRQQLEQKQQQEHQQMDQENTGSKQRQQVEKQHQQQLQDMQNQHQTQQQQVHERQQEEHQQQRQQDRPAKSGSQDKSKSSDKPSKSDKDKPSKP